jgi:hypothetical protein
MTETELARAGIESAIDTLVAQDIVDRTRVGLFGFSRFGMHVQYFLAFSDYPIVAATIADSMSLTPEFYAALYGYSYPGMTEFEWETWPGQLQAGTSNNAIGAPFWGEGIQRWLDRSYLFHLDRIVSAVRYEQFGARQIPPNWTPYAILSRFHRPVEMVHLPLAQHQLIPPLSRLTSQEGNVDWFDFWLNAHEDRDPAKAEQYVRWRHLRDQRTTLLRGPRPALNTWRPTQEGDPTTSQR